MEQLIFYLKLGFMHILDINAYDHFLFIVSITIPFSFRNFKRLFWIITFFTIGHSTSIILSTFKIFNPDMTFIEILIPVTIIASAISNIFITKNLNKVIDVNYYPVEEARNSNMRHRPIGIGVQGLADTFILMRHAFDSPEAKQLNAEIFETIYFAAMESSMEIAQKEGPYKTYEGSPVSKGIFQFDMWGVVPSSKRWDWTKLKREVKKHGVRNSLLLAPMPTASTSQILGNNECFEPYTSNIYTRRVLSGEFIVVNKHLLKDLIKLKLWDENMKDTLMAANGSIQDIKEIPDDIKLLYRTVWEVSQKSIIDMAADRGAYICQSQSMNIHMQDANFGKLTSMHFHAWRKGLKTGLYYLRTKAAADAIKFTIVKDEKAIDKEQEQAAMQCSIDNQDDCEMCGS